MLFAAAIAASAHVAHAGGRFAITAPLFDAGGEIPSEYTCEGANVSPALMWSGAPAGTKAFALVVDDPDAPDPAKPQRTWVHWVVPSLPANAIMLAKAATPAAGKNDWGKTEWGGLCPPVGRHRYFFKLYALDADVGRPGMTKAELLAVIAGHQLAYAELIGTYQKHK
jgi:Raf kinase inhibitor-like YbhB/YbcL family protein